MKLTTLLLAGLVTLAAGLSPAFASASSSSHGTGPPVNFALIGDLSGDAIALGFFAVVLVVGSWLGRCAGQRKKD